MKKIILLLVTFSSVAVLAGQLADDRFALIKRYNIPQSAKRALLSGFEHAEYYDYDQFASSRYMLVIDFTQNSVRRRGYLVDFRKGKLSTYLVAHGEKSGDGSGNVVAFSNIVDSHQSSLGLYQASKVYRGKHGKSMRLVGLESTNDRAYERAIVLHSADYVSEDYIRQHGVLGTSWGCPAVEKEHIRYLIRKLRHRSFIYIYHEKFSDQ